jgi:hypothetical protein
MTHPFRSGDAVRVLTGPCAGETWVVAVYDAANDIAWIAGWPCTMVTKASEALALHRACSDEEHHETLESVRNLRGDHGEGDPRRSAYERIVAAGGAP